MCAKCWAWCIDAAQPQPAELLRLYVERFNQRDWNGVRELIHADARLRITNLFAGRLEEGYFVNFGLFPHPWKLAPGELDHEQVVFLLGGWIPETRLQLWSALTSVVLRSKQFGITRAVPGCLLPPKR
jgi:hypothetical protein